MIIDRCYRAAVCDARGSIELYRAVEELSSLLGITVFEDRMDKIIEKYNDLFQSGRRTEAQQWLEEYLQEYH